MINETYVTGIKMVPIQVNNEIIEGINRINLLGVLNVRGYCIIIEGRLITYVMAADVAVGAGLVEIKHNRVATNVDTGVDNPYQTIIWNRVEDYFNQAVKEIEEYNKTYNNGDNSILDFIQPFDRNSFILLEVAMGILNKVNSQKGKEFRGALMMYVVPMIQQQAIMEYQMQIQEMQNEIEDLQDRVDYQNDYLNLEGLFSSTEIAKQFNLTSQELHKILKEYGILYKTNGVWALKIPYSNFPYTQYVDISTPTGVTTVMYWTEPGRGFVHSVLSSLGFRTYWNNQPTKREMLKK